MTIEPISPQESIYKSVRESICSYSHRYSPSESNPSFAYSVSLESLLDLHLLYQQDHSKYFYLECKDTLICMMHHNDNRMALISSSSLAFRKFLQKTEVSFL